MLVKSFFQCIYSLIKTQVPNLLPLIFEQLLCLPNTYVGPQVPKEKRLLSVPKLTETTEEQEKRSVTYHMHIHNITFFLISVWNEV